MIELDGYEIYEGYDISMESQGHGECMGRLMLILGGKYSNLKL